MAGGLKESGGTQCSGECRRSGTQFTHEKDLENGIDVRPLVVCVQRRICADSVHNILSGYA